MYTMYFIDRRTYVNEKDDPLSKYVSNLIDTKIQTMHFIDNGGHPEITLSVVVLMFSFVGPKPPTIFLQYCGEITSSVRRRPVDRAAAQVLFNDTAPRCVSPDDIREPSSKRALDGAGAVSTVREGRFEKTARFE
ncbi:hypothetical protein NQ318_008738 [Aromia moschata]|uniref:Uncharacterized protein n=1 Tax=Aromia moschata TaxID=1265417 RepID=A0AAV8X3R6_9CUCU|nr:hypothetical protein NQ318_008738 [Aromia moschata]